MSWQSLLLCVLQVSSSGVTLTHDRGYTDNIAEDFDNELDEQNSEDGKDDYNKSSVGRDYIADNYTDVVIIDGKMLKQSVCL